MLDSLIKTAHKLGPFDPRTQYEQFWVLSAMNQLLGYYANNLMRTMGSNLSEMDLVARYWSVFDRSFDDVKVITTRDRSCEATSIRINEGRRVDRVSEIKHKRPSIRPDLLLIRKEVEYGCSELGKIDDMVPTRKEIAETELHCPKTMKDIFDRAVYLAKNNKNA
ncbi:hypothetical protein BDC45DRAFT_239639 [Circinella umbellata]|nr:hypothetical protein BDC45DRAFT_239639 [Circinella umbellata]